MNLFINSRFILLNGKVFRGMSQQKTQGMSKTELIVAVWFDKLIQRHR